MRTSALFVALVAVLGGLLTALPAEAAAYKVFLKSSRVAINSAGNGKVAVKCNVNRTCKGKISFGAARVRAYKVPAKKTAYVKVAMSNALNPKSQGPGFQSKTVQLKINEDSPKNITHHYKMAAETVVSSSRIVGTVNGTGPLAKNVRVDLIRTLRGGNTQVLKGKDITASDNTYNFPVALGANNSSSEVFRLRISGTDQNNVRRSWYWRGSGGGAYLRDSQGVQATKSGPRTANFNYHTVSGTTGPGAEVSVVGTPASFSGGAAVRRELDFPSCGNIFGQTTAASNGSYSIGFIPETTMKRYMVGARSGATRAYYGQSGERFGSCYDALNYKLVTASANLFPLTASKSLNADVSLSGNTVTVKPSFSPAYKPTYNDRWISIRERIPGLGVLDSPIVTQIVTGSNGTRQFTNMAPGNYWVEVGRRTGCSDWYGSVYPNNRLYFKGADRYAENWKSFKRVRDLKGSATTGLEVYARTANPNPATNAQNKIPKGKKGWMYRNYCKALGTGTINSLTITGTHKTISKPTSRSGKGGIVSGRVTRIGGKTNKEMLVRLSTSSGSRVVRTDFTDSKGRFYIAGLSSGKYTISVNSDSWRGIGRSFSGKKSVKVKAGRTTSVGTLRFKH